MAITCCRGIEKEEYIGSIETDVKLNSSAQSDLYGVNAHHTLEHERKEKVDLKCEGRLDSLDRNS